MPLAISSSSSMPVFWPSICHLSLSSPPCMSFSAAYFYFHPVPSASFPQLFPLHLVSFIVPPSMLRALYSKTTGNIPKKKGSRIVFLCHPSSHSSSSSSSFLFVLSSYLRHLPALRCFSPHTHTHTHTHTAIHTKCWINSLSVPALRRWSFISGGCGKVTGWLPIIKTSSSEMTLSTVIDFSFFSHPTKDIQLADDYSATVSLKVNSARL